MFLHDVELDGLGADILAESDLQVVLDGEVRSVRARVIKDGTEPSALETGSSTDTCPLQQRSQRLAATGPDHRHRHGETHCPRPRLEPM